MDKKTFFNIDNNFSSKNFSNIKLKINDETYFYFFNLIMDYKTNTLIENETNLLDETNLNNIMNSSSSISSLAIEGIHTSKKAQNSINDRVFSLENELVKKENNNSSTVKDYELFINKEYKKYLDSSNDKRVVSKIAFAQNLGLNLANFFLNAMWSDSYISFNHSILKEVYNRLTCGGLNLGKNIELPNENFPDGNYYRKDIVKIYSGFNVVDEGVTPEKVEEYMQNLFNFIASPSKFYLNTPKDYRYRVYEIIAIIHFLFVRIHPYYDGNGRMARLITNSLLEKMANIPDTMFNFGIKITRPIYYESIKKGRTDNNLTYFIRYYFYLTRAIEEIVLFNREHTRSTGTSFTEKEIESLMILILFQEKSFITWKEIQGSLSDKDFTSESTMKNILIKLEKCGYIVKVRINKNVHYRLANKYLWTK